MFLPRFFSDSYTVAFGPFEVKGEKTKKENG